MALSLDAEAHVVERPVKVGNVKAGNESAAEGVEVLERSFAEVVGGEVGVKRGKVGRHLRMHRMDFGVRMHKH